MKYSAIYLHPVAISASFLSTGCPCFFLTQPVFSQYHTLSLSSSHWDGREWSSQASVLHHTLTGDAALAGRLCVCVCVHVDVCAVHMLVGCLMSLSAQRPYCHLTALFLSLTHSWCTCYKGVCHKCLPWDSFSVSASIPPQQPPGETHWHAHSLS